ncbi:hypothetical protein [uncultured Hymenobacter sp.]|uniref:hypothetical protein n=1 Tax=uncultured Hymenobacter sp. TaxID=170016 RepID=UPI0035CA9DF6
MAKKPNPIGFTKPMPAEAESYLQRSRLGDDDEEEEKHEEKPPRAPKVVLVFVGAIEGNEIMAAYDLYPLTPLSNLEQQMLQIIAALEQKVEQLEHN